MNRRHLFAAGAAASLGASVAMAAPKSTPTRREVRGRDGARIFHREFGEGPPMLFVASWALHSAMWDPQIAWFSERGRRCIAFDRRGHGRSDLTAGGYDLDTLADDLAAVIETLDLRDVTLVAHSMGAAETIRHVARHGSSRIKRLAFLAPVAPFILKTADNPYGAPEAFHEATVRRYATDFPGWAYENQPSFFTPSTSAPLKEALTRQLLETPAPVAIRCFRSLYRTDLRADLARIDKPLLILHGAKDAQAPVSITGERVAAGVRGARLKVYPDAPHGLWVTHQSEVNADLEAFMAA